MFGSEKGCSLQFPSCLFFPSGSEQLLSNMAREPVILNVYDMVCIFAAVLISNLNIDNAF